MSNQTKYVQNITLCRVARLQKISKIFIAIEFKAKHSDDSLINLLKNHLLISNTGKKVYNGLLRVEFQFFRFLPDKIFSKHISVQSGKTSNCFSKMMMAAGAESPSVATQSAKTDILQKIGQRGNNHQENENALGKIRNEHV